MKSFSSLPSIISEQSPPQRTHQSAVWRLIRKSGRERHYYSFTPDNAEALLQGHKSQQRIRGRRICFSVPRVHGHIETSDALMNGDGLFGHPLYPTVKSRYRRYEDAGKNPPTLPCSARIRHHKSIINAEPAVRCTSTSCRSNLQPSPRS